MRQFFRGWKRKLGCVTLALACLFLVGWVRSISHIENVTLPFGEGSSAMWASGIDGNLVVAHSITDTPGYYGSRPSWTRRRLEKGEERGIEHFFSSYRGYSGSTIFVSEMWEIGQTRSRAEK